MTALLLSPHNDDETLFAAFTIIRERPHVIVCFASLAQSFTDPTITAERRQHETRRALNELAPGAIEFDQWRAPDWPKVSDDSEGWLRDLMSILKSARQYDRVYAPLPEAKGDPQHNLVGELAWELWRSYVTFYCTYQLHSGKTTSGRPVPYEAEWMARKRRALAQYESQLSLPSTSHHFEGNLDEYYAD